MSPRLWALVGLVGAALFYATWGAYSMMDSIHSAPVDFARALFYVIVSVLYRMVPVALIMGAIYLVGVAFTGSWSLS